jgi:DNA-binding LacI/PurR family transcriptional regulator
MNSEPTISSDLLVIKKEKGKGPLYQRIAKILKTRILHGDYSLKAIPSERKLAQEFGINFMTVRRSLRALAKDGFLIRLTNGRLSVKGAGVGRKRYFNFAFLLPANASGVSAMMEKCRRALEAVSEKFSASIRPVLFSHWNDPALLDSVMTFDGVFLYPFEDEPPAAVLSHLRSAGHPVVVLDHDFTRFGIPSLHFFPPVFAQKLLDHLDKQGHRSIGCLNTQSQNMETLSRINQWRLWMAAHGFTGRLVDKPVELHGSTGHHAYTAMKKLLKEDRGSETAWVCVTMPAAIGAIRAMSDLGIRPGDDMAVCAINGEGLADLLVPSVTALEQPDLQTFLKYTLQWMLSGNTVWQGPLLLQPGDARVVVRDSTRKKII